MTDRSCHGCVLREACDRRPSAILKARGVVMRTYLNTDLGILKGSMISQVVS
jgi:hypothetical protein